MPNDSFIIIGIDPGITGAMAAINQDAELVGLYDMPVMSGTGSRQQVNGTELAKIIQSIRLGQVMSARMEDVSTMPSDGRVGAFAFGKGVGVILGILMTLQIPYTLVRPQEWKKRAGLWKKDKEASRTLAQQLYPEASLARKKDDGRAEAILIARFGT